MIKKEDHYCFTLPSNPNLKIWRYMDFTKYVSLLESKSLFFSRSDLLGDPYEGATSHANQKLRSHFSRNAPIPDNILNDMSDFAEWLRQWIFINCWHLNEFESHAMWKLYTKSNESIVIQSTVGLLKSLLPEEINIGSVKYIDYKTDWLPEENIFLPFVHKRNSFQHENEIRAIIQNIDYIGEKIQNKEVNYELGKMVKVNLSDLIQNVYLSPESQEWFTNLVKQVTERYNYNFNIYPSKLLVKPIF